MRFCSRLLLVVVLALSFHGARAQDVAAARPVDEAKSAAIIELLKTTGSINLIKTVLARMTEVMKKGRDASDQSKIDRYMASLNPDELKDQIVQMYARHFSMDEIRGITAFYKSPVGHKLLGEMPSMVSESMTMGQEWSTKKVAALTKQLDAEAAAMPAIPAEKK